MELQTMMEFFTLAGSRARNVQVAHRLPAAAAKAPAKAARTSRSQGGVDEREFTRF
jgi:hypothetical protein